MRKAVSILFVAWLFSMSAWAIFPMQLVNNSPFDDSQIYVGILGERLGVAMVGQPLGSSPHIYYDLSQNSASRVVLAPLNESVNTLHKQPGDWGYANVFTTLDQIPNKTIYIDRSQACRLFVSFGEPMYLHAFNAGYAGADLNNPSDPNATHRWEVAEFTYDQYDVMFINTTRVDAFQFPMAVDLYGDVAAGANNAHMSRGEVCTYSEVIGKWNEAYATTKYNYCKINRITADTLGPIIMQPSKVQQVKNTGTFDDYIDEIWSAFQTKTLRARMGEIGVWYGRVENGIFVMHHEGGAEVAYISRPTTNDVIEGAGTFAIGSVDDKRVQAQFCGAMNRGMIDCGAADNVEQNWGDTERFFTTNTYNEYVKFFHRADISLGKYTYAFCYDDTFDQSSTCATSHPASVTLTIGGYSDQQPFDTGTGESLGGNPTPGGNDNPGGNSGATEDTDVTAQGLRYSMTFTQDGLDVTVQFSVLNPQDFVGLVPVVWDRTNGFTEYIGVDTHTFENCTPGEVLTVACKWMFAGGDTFTRDYQYTVAPLGGVPTEVEELPQVSSQGKIEIRPDGRVLIIHDGRSYNLMGMEW
ncbi:MAG: beta-1,3-glucanase family protein [Paludibacteraceae bacterium]|nr:beta-1,3-glucanase family protein [Paludibacteraceae bacterium]